MLTPLSSADLSSSRPDRNPELWQAAQSLEATFLAEMLKSAGLGVPRDSFGGGAGEAPFAGLLVNEYASSLAATGGVGLAESIYESLVKKEVS